MNNEELYEKMCDGATAPTVKCYPTTKQLFELIATNTLLRTATMIIHDLHKWCEVNQYAYEQDWSIDMILVGYYMRVQYSKCWDTKTESWYSVSPVVDE